MEAPSIMHKMEGLRRNKDRSYKNVFKGSVLVSTLMDHDKSKFASRDAAVKFAQRLLEGGHIESIVGSKSFEDSVHLYRWSDETLVRDARRMVSTTSHIPRRRLIELIDLQQGGDGGADTNNNNTSNGYHMRDVQDRIIAQAEQAADKTDRNFKEVQAERAIKSRERRRRRQTLDSTQLAESSGSLLNQSEKPKDGGETESNLLRSSSMSSETLSSPSLRVRPTSPSGPNKGEVEGTRSAATEPTRQRSRAARNAEKAKLTTQDGAPSPERVRSPIVSSGSTTSKAEERVKSPVNSIGDERVRPTIPAPTTPDEKGRSILDERMKSPTTIADLDDKLKSSVNTSRSIEDRVRSPQPIRSTDESPRVLSPVTTKDTPSTDEEKKEKEGVSTCRYDGVDMPALDIENYDLTHHRNRPSTNKSLEDLAEQSYSYSDNEKQLLEEMKRMQQEHETAVAQYEEKILDLMSTMTDLRKLADELARNKNKSEIKDDPGLSLIGSPAVVPETPRPPAPPPPPPPTMMQRTLKPSKPQIKPRLKMRPLFWSRIVIDDNTRSNFIDGNFWQTATEPNFDVDEFERMFGKSADKESAKVKSLHDALSTKVKGKGKKQTAKILDETRSRAVAIKLRSLHCQMDDVRQAVYKMDFSKIDLDSLYSLFEIRGEPDELDKIKVHIQANEDVPLDQPEQFLLELSQMSHLPERMECMIFKKRFNESLFTIDQQLTTIQNASDELKKSERLQTVLEFILAFGNYMNGGTQRGQADGFDLSILPKLKDVKSMDNNLTLLQYIVRVYTKEHEPDAGRSEAIFRLPESTQIHLAASVSFTDLEKELAELQHQLQTRKKMTELVCQDTEVSLLQPFKDQMEDFFESADDMLKHQKEQTAETKAKFQEFLQFMAIKDVTEQVTPEWLFGLWATFLDDYRRCWDVEQTRFARLMFEKVEQKRKDRIRQAKRRKSNMDPDKAGLKQKFSHRRRSDVSQTVKLLRSMSASAALDQEDNDDRPKRRRRPHTDDMSDTGDVISFRAAPDSKPRDPNKPETMAEKVHRRRTNRLSSDDTPSLSRADSRESLSSVASSAAPSLNVIRRVRARHMSEDLRHLMPSMSDRYDTDSDMDARFRRRRRVDDVDENIRSVDEQNLPDEAKGEGNRRRRLGRDEAAESPVVGNDASQIRSRDGAKTLSNSRARYHSQEDILENGGRKSPSPPPRPNLPAGYSNPSPRVRAQLRSDDLEGTDLDSQQPRQYRDALRRMSKSRSNSASIEHLINGPMKVQWKQESNPTSLHQRIRSRSNTQEISPISRSLQPQFSDSSHPIRRRQSREDDFGSRRSRQLRGSEGESNI